MEPEAESSLAVPGGEEVNINIHCLSGSKFSVKTSLESTVGEFKNVLAQKCDVPALQQRLIYNGRILKDHQTLGVYGLQADHTVHMVHSSAPPAAAPPSAPASTWTTNSPSDTQGGGPFPCGTGVAGAGSSLFPGLGFSPLHGHADRAMSNIESSPEGFDMHRRMYESVQGPLLNALTAGVGDTTTDAGANSFALLLGNQAGAQTSDRSNSIAGSESGATVPNASPLLNPLNNTGGSLTNNATRTNPADNARSPSIARLGGFAIPESYHRGLLISAFRRLLESSAMAQMRQSLLSNPQYTDQILGLNPQLRDILLNPRIRDMMQNPELLRQLTSREMMQMIVVLQQLFQLTRQQQQFIPTNRAGDARPPSIAGFGGFAIPGSYGTGMTDTSASSELLEDSAVAQMRQSLLSNPQYTDQILRLNPQLRDMLPNPRIRNMMQNPEIFRQLTSRGMMQQMMALQRRRPQLTRRQQQQQFPPEGAQIGRGMRIRIRSGLRMNMSGRLGAGSFAVPNNPYVPPEQLYATQLAQLQDMGFYDTLENIRALLATSGNFQAAVQRLLRNHGH